VSTSNQQPNDRCFYVRILGNGSTKACHVMRRSHNQYHGHPFTEATAAPQGAGLRELLHEALNHLEDTSRFYGTGIAEGFFKRAEAALSAPEVRCDVASEACRPRHPNDDGSNVCLQHYDVMEDHPDPTDERIVKTVLIYGKFPAAGGGAMSQ
jgi:hypothetical protein